MTAFDALQELADAIQHQPELLSRGARAYFAKRLEAAVKARWARKGRPGGRVHAAVNDSGRVIGQNHPHAKLTDEQVERVHLMRRAGLSYRKIADRCGISKSQVERICKYRQRADLTMGHKRVWHGYQCTPAHPDEFDVVH